jgi:hypothetical protein
MTARARLTFCTALLVAGCGGGGGGGGNAGDKLVSGRDLSEPFFWDGNTLAYLRATADPSQPQPQDLWRLDLSTGTPSVALTGIDWAPPTSWPRSRAGQLLITGPSGRLFYDFGSGTGVDLSGFGMVTPPGQPSDGLFGPIAGLSDASGTFFPITLIRRDAGAVALAGGNGGTVGVGWPTALTSMTLPGSIGEMAYLGEDLVLLYAPYSDGADQQAGIYRLRASTGELTQLVGPRPIADFQSIAGSCSFYGDCLLRVVGCRDTDPACPDTGEPPCMILYGVKGDDPGTTTLVPHAYDVVTGTDLRLSDAVRRFAISPDQHRVVWDDGNAVMVNSWDVCTGQRLQCPNTPSGRVIWRGDGNVFVSVDPTTYVFGVASFTADACTGQAYPMAVYGVQFSPDGSRLLWLGNAPSSPTVSQAWLAAADGSGPVKVAEGDIFGVGFSGDGRRIFVGRGSTSNAGLSWLDPDASPVMEHLLADNYGGFSSIGNRRVLLVDHWNSQDGNGELTLIDLESGDRQRLGRAVTDMTTAGSVDDEGTSVAYTVRTRVSSDRDGLWLTTLPP